MHISKEDTIIGCLVGCAIGDSIGLPYEGLSPHRIKHFMTMPLEHSFLGHFGMVSDDTDHSIFVAQAVLCSDGDVNKFRTHLAWRLRFWLLCFPAGIGLSTLKSIFRLWMGFSKTSGVYSAGNGPSMRSAIIGAIFCNDSLKRKSYVEASTLLTHTDPRALIGALAIAEITARLVNKEWQVKPTIEELTSLLSNLSSNIEWQTTVTFIGNACSSKTPILIANQFFGGKYGVSGYTLHAIPFAIIVWYCNYGRFRNTIENIVEAGGDVDTVCAIAGALTGATVGYHGIPLSWREDLIDWPHSISYIVGLAKKCSDTTVHVSTHFSPWLFPRGVFFAVIVLLHGLRRLLPPY